MLFRNWPCRSIFGPWQGITAEQNATVASVSTDLTETFGSAAYYNEQYPADANWQDMQWGSNYERLQSIKQQVDPDGVFSCRNCVGSEAGFWYIYIVDYYINILQAKVMEMVCAIFFPFSMAWLKVCVVYNFLDLILDCGVSFKAFRHWKYQTIVNSSTQ